MLSSRMVTNVLTVLKDATRTEYMDSWEGAGYEQWREQVVTWHLAERQVAEAVFRYPDSAHYSPSAKLTVFFRREEYEVSFQSENFAMLKSLGL